MATRFYLPSSGTPPLGSLSVRSDWEQTTGLVRLPSYTTKKNTALTSSNRTWPSTATQQWAWYQYQSEQLLAAYSWTTADTVSMVLGKLAETSNGGDTHLAYIVRVVSSDGATERGVIGLYHATSTEFPLTAAAATRIHSASVNGATNFSSQIGDRIIIELGVHGVTPAAESIQMRVGDPTASADFALTAALTTDLDPWVELSKTVSLGVPPIDLVIGDNIHSHLSDNVVITQDHSLSVDSNLHSNISDAPVITQVHILAIDENIHSTISDGNIVVTQIEPAIDLFPNDNIHSHLSDNIDVTQVHIVTINDNVHSHLSDTPTITQVHIITVNDNMHSHLSDNITITVDPINLTVNSNIHSHVSDNITITQIHVLSTNDNLHEHISDNVTVTQIHSLVVNDNVHAHLSDLVNVTQIHSIIVGDNIHSHTSDSVNISQIHSLLINDNVHSHLADGNLVVQVNQGETPIDLFPNDNLHAHISDSAVVTQVHVLTINNNVHSLISDGAINVTLEYNLLLNYNIHQHLSDSVTVVQVHILSIDSNIHSHISDNVVVSKNDIDLYPSDNVHSHESDSVIIMQTISQRKLQILGFIREPQLDGTDNIVYTLTDPRLDRKDGVKNKYKLTIYNDGMYKFETFMYRLPEFFLNSDSYYGIISTNAAFIKIYSQLKGHLYNMAEYPFPPHYYSEWL